MKRDIALRELNQRADALKAMGATSLYLFGSTVRDEAAEGSDIDLFIDYDRESRFSLLDLVGIKLYLEDELLIPIDVTTRDSLHPLLSERIQQDAVRVFDTCGSLAHPHNASPASAVSFNAATNSRP